VAQGVGGQLDVGIVPEAAEGEVGRPSGEALSFQGQEQCGPVAVRQLGAPGEPGIECVADLGVEWDLAVAVALAAAHGDDALAGADGHVFTVEGSQLMLREAPLHQITGG